MLSNSYSNWKSLGKEWSYKNMYTSVWRIFHNCPYFKVLNKGWKACIWTQEKYAPWDSYSKWFLYLKTTQPLPGGGAAQVTLTSVFFKDDICMMALGHWLLYFAMLFPTRVKLPTFWSPVTLFSDEERSLGSTTNMNLSNVGWYLPLCWPRRLTA